MKSNVFCYRLYRVILFSENPMDEQRYDNQLEPIYDSSGPIQDVALKTSQEQRTIETGGKRGSRRSTLTARHDDDIYIYIYIYVCMYVCMYVYISIYT